MSRWWRALYSTVTQLSQSWSKPHEERFH
uniref:Uncharacterized protein n=1 Tax=Anguilla anguilla TaxID=7936 RepID=A0A0E9QUS2_ANGAN